jgi:hypothetical protein
LFTVPKELYSLASQCKRPPRPLAKTAAAPLYANGMEDEDDEDDDDDEEEEEEEEERGGGKGILEQRLEHAKVEKTKNWRRRSRRRMRSPSSSSSSSSPSSPSPGARVLQPNAQEPFFFLLLLLLLQDSILFSSAPEEEWYYCLLLLLVQGKRTFAKEQPPQSLVANYAGINYNGPRR